MSRFAEEELLARLPPELDIASVNSPELCVVSGDNEALDRFQADLAADGHRVRSAFLSILPRTPACWSPFSDDLKHI